MFNSNEKEKGILKFSVAIDGPAGSGKSTIAKILGDKFNLMYINTGAMYRAVTLLALRQGIECSDKIELSKLIESMEMHFEKERLIVNGEDISEAIAKPQVANLVSLFAAVPEVRNILVKEQQRISHNYNVIMDGRDIGTVVLKDSPLKFYITASAEERARRRYEEFKNKNIKIEYKHVLEDMIKRDYIDSNREISPLKKASDAIEVETSQMSIETVVNEISKFIIKYIEKIG